MLRARIVPKNGRLDKEKKKQEKDSKTTFSVTYYPVH